MPLYHTLLFFVFLHSYYLLCSSRPSFISSLPLSLYLRLLYLDYKLPLDRYPFPHGPPPPLHTHTHTHTLSLIQTLTHLRISVILCITLTGRVSIPQHRIVFISVAATTSLLFSFVFFCFLLFSFVFFCFLLFSCSKKASGWTSHMLSFYLSFFLSPVPFPVPCQPVSTVSTGELSAIPAYYLLLTHTHTHTPNYHDDVMESTYYLHLSIEPHDPTRFDPTRPHNQIKSDTTD